MAYFLKTFIFFALFTFLNAQIFSGWNYGRYYATAPAGIALARPAAVVAPVPIARPVVAAPTVPVVVPGYAPFAPSAVLLGSNKGTKNN